MNLAKLCAVTAALWLGPSFSAVAQYHSNPTCNRLMVYSATQSSDISVKNSDFTAQLALFQSRMNAGEGDEALAALSRSHRLIGEAVAAMVAIQTSVEELRVKNCIPERVAANLNRDHAELLTNARRNLESARMLEQALRVHGKISFDKDGCLITGDRVNDPQLAGGEWYLLNCNFKGPPNSAARLRR